MGIVKDRNSKNLTEAEEIKMWKEYTKNYARNFSMTLITTMVTQLEPDIMECEVKWTLGSISNEQS